MLGELLRHQVALGDLQLLLAGVAGDLQHLHAVAQRRRDRVEHVGRGDEDDVRQIEGHLQVVIGEGGVLLRVEHLEQRRRRVAAEIGAQLVDLVEHEDRVACPDPPHSLDDAARQRADVRAPVAANLGLVAHAAQRDADELASQRAGDRLAERGLADAGRPREAEDRPLLPRRQLAHRQVLQDALLDLLEVVVVGVEDLARLLEVEPVFGPLGPRQLDEPLQVGALDRVLGRRLRHLLQAIELLARGLLHLLGHLGRLDLLLERVEVLASSPSPSSSWIAFSFWRSTASRWCLENSSRTCESIFCFTLMSSTLRCSSTSRRRSRSATSSSTSSEARSSGDRSTVAATMSPRRAGILVLVEHLRRLVRDVGRDGDQLLGHVVDRHAEAVDLDRVLADLDQRLVRGDQVRLLLHEAGHAAPLGPAQHGGDAVLGGLDDADHLALDADGVEVLAGGLFDVGVLLRADQDARAFAAQRLDEAQRAGATNLDRHHRAGKQHQVAQRQERERLRGIAHGWFDLCFRMPRG